MSYFNGSLQLAVGSNMPPGSLQPIETWFPFAPRATPISKGIPTIVDGLKRRFDGAKQAFWDFAIVDYADLDTFVMATAGSWEIDNTEVTIITLVRGSTYATANATLYTPVERTEAQPSGEYNPDTSFKVTGVRLHFMNVVRTGAFSSGFDMGHDI